MSLCGRTNNPTAPGEVIFSDVCGPLPVESLGRERYFITFSDGYSSFKEVAMMSSKDEALQCFKDFQSRFERKNECKVKLLYSDNGG